MTGYRFSARPRVPVTTLTLALSKGRIFDETLPLLAAAGIVPVRGPGDLAQARSSPPTGPACR